MDAIRIPIRDLCDAPVQVWQGPFDLNGTRIAYPPQSRVPGRLQLRLGGANAEPLRAYAHNGNDIGEPRLSDDGGWVTLEPNGFVDLPADLKGSTKLFVRLLPGDGLRRGGNVSTRPYTEQWRNRRTVDLVDTDYLWGHLPDSPSGGSRQDNGLMQLAGELDDDADVSLIVMRPGHGIYQPGPFRRSGQVTLPGLQSSAARKAVPTVLQLAAGATGRTVVLPHRLLTAYELRQFRRCVAVWGVRPSVANGALPRTATTQLAPALTFNHRFTDNTSGNLIRNRFFMGHTLASTRWALARINLGTPDHLHQLGDRWLQNEVTLTRGSYDYDCFLEFVLDDGEPDLWEVESAEIDAGDATVTLGVNDITSMVLPTSAKRPRLYAAAGHASAGTCAMLDNPPALMNALSNNNCIGTASTIAGGGQRVLRTVVGHHSTDQRSEGVFISCSVAATLARVSAFVGV